MFVFIISIKEYLAACFICHQGLVSNVPLDPLPLQGHSKLNKGRETIPPGIWMAQRPRGTTRVRVFQGGGGTGGIPLPSPHQRKNPKIQIPGGIVSRPLFSLKCHEAEVDQAEHC